MNIDILRAAFDARAFTAREAGLVLASNPRRTLSHLLLEGYVERVRRGVYRIAPEARARILRTRADMKRDAVLGGPFRIALDGPDAVRAWTGGRYNIVPAGGEAFWLVVEEADADAFEVWLKKRGIPFASPESWPATRGLGVVLRRAHGLRVRIVDGLPVVSRADVERLIASEPIAYEGAREWLIEDSAPRGKEL